jgi:hypothetical protein
MSYAENPKREAIAHLIETFPDQSLKNIPWEQGLSQLENLIMFKLQGNLTGDLYAVHDLFKGAFTPSMPFTFAFVFDSDQLAVRVLPYPEQYENKAIAPPRRKFATIEQSVSSDPLRVATAIAAMVTADKEQGNNKIIIMQVNAGRGREKEPYVLGHLLGGLSEITEYHPLFSWIEQTKEELNAAYIPPDKK